MQKILALSVILFFSSLAITNADNSEKIIKDIEFAKVGKHSLKLDLHLPEKVKGSGLVVWIHGGGWRKGTKENCSLKWLPKHGYTVASISYRLSDVAKFPAQLHDCKAAVRWLRANAKKYGYETNKIAVAGSSAGGHLAALMGTTSGKNELEGKVGGNLEHSSSIEAVIDYYGATDFVLRSKTQPTRANDEGSVVYDLLGGGAHEKVELAKLASAVYHVNDGDPPLLIFHGDNDKTVLLDQSEAIAKAYETAGLSSKLHVIEGGGHGGNVFYSGKNGDLVLDFLKDKLGKGN